MGNTARAGLSESFRTIVVILGLSETYYYHLMNEQIARPCPKHIKKSEYKHIFADQNEDCVNLTGIFS